MELSNKGWLKIAAVTLLTLGIALATPSSARAGIDPGDACEANGGIWVGADVFNGTCTYPSGDLISIQNCGDNYRYLVHFSAGFETGHECDATERPPGPSGAETGPSDEIVTICLGGEKNGCVTFPAGTCAQKCTISPTLPGGAANALPANAYATLYVRDVVENGEPGTDSYTLCFNNQSGQAVIIYKFIGGAWVALTLSSTANPVCIISSGEGAFYLGG